MSMNDKLASLGTLPWPVLSDRAQERARRHAFALTAVAAVFVLKRLFVADPGGATAFLLFDAAVAAAALAGGIEPALTAIAASALLGARVLADREISTLAAVLLFALQAGVVAAIVLRLRAERGESQRAFDAEQQELARTREAMRALERQHAASAREMTEVHERFRAETEAEHQAMLGRLDATAGQLQRLEALTDPALSELPTALVLDELLHRIQTTLAADAAVLVDARDPNTPVAYGPSGATIPVRRETLKRKLSVGQRSSRVHLVQNDPERLAEISVMAWRNPVATLVSVPVACAGATLGVVEVAMYRARRWTDWDTALLRIVADRAAWVLMNSMESPAEIARRA
jgi:GAF domain